MFYLLSFFCILFGSASANEIGFGYNPDLDVGEKPTLILTPDADVRVARVRIEAGGKTYSFEKGTAGEDIVFAWDRDTSVTEATAYVDVVFADGYTSQAQVPISYSYGSSIEVDLSRGKSRLGQRH